MGETPIVVAQDENNVFYVAVDAEIKDNWKWFLTILESTHMETMWVMAQTLYLIKNTHFFV